MQFSGRHSVNSSHVRKVTMNDESSPFFLSVFLFFKYKKKKEKFFFPRQNDANAPRVTYVADDSTKCLKTIF
jgi:hypothetical protein